MIAFLGVAILLSTVSAQICPLMYDLKEGRCIRPLILEKEMVWNDQIPQSRVECKKDGATLPIIKDYYELESFNRIANTFPEIKGTNIYIVMDLVCNTSTRRLQWIDGSSVDYAPGISNFRSFDCVSNGETFISKVMDDEFYDINCNKKHTLTVLCSVAPTEPTTLTTTTSTTVKTTTTPCDCSRQCTLTPTQSTTTTTVKPSELPIDKNCGDYSLMPDATEKPCVKVFTDRQSWDVAQKTCTADFGTLITINSADENKFFWRTAVSNNLLDGVHIGAHQLAEDPSVWAWIDGEVPFNGKTYDNFIGSFPISGAGECGSMMTESSSAQWINEECANRQPFFCRREDFSNLPKDCPKDAPKAGVDIVPPGFPNPNISCEYVMFVAANKIVELEILVLVTDINNDFLEILEGSSGANLLANLTGSLLTPIKIRTTKSNVMRVNWKTNGAGINRGFKIRYNEVQP